MISRLLATSVALLLVAAANATITASSVALGSPLGEGTWTYDITVTLTDGPNPGDPDDWTAASLTADLTGGATFVNNYSENPPGYVPSIPVIYDTFFTSPELYPNGPVLRCVSFGNGPVEEPAYLFGEWYDTANTGNGDFVIARLSVNDPGVEAYLDIFLRVAAANTGGQLFDYEWHIPVPEPGGLVLLALGGLALVRRR
jgi:hypothetical protein